MNQSIPTCGQLERSLSQSIQAFYRDKIGQRPSKVTCQLFDEKVAIIIENSISNAEQLLFQEGQTKLVEEIHSALDEVIKPQLKALMEEILKVGVLDLLSDATQETGRTGMIAVLTETPQVRNPEVLPKSSK
jgi:uncharacterized protein YbcI